MAFFNSIKLYVDIFRRLCNSVQSAGPEDRHSGGDEEGEDPAGGGRGSHERAPRDQLAQAPRQVQPPKHRSPSRHLPWAQVNYRPFLCVFLLLQKLVLTVYHFKRWI